MTTPVPLGLQVFEPLWVTEGGTYIETVDRPDAYSHVIRAFGGYWSASFRLSGKLEALEDWLQSGLGRHVEVYDDALDLCWEGFANRIQLNAGTKTFIRGPLLDVRNRASVTYTRLLTVTEPPTRGEQDTTAVSNDTSSQAKWGIRPIIYSGGEQTDAGALVVRDTFLAENAEPRTTHQDGGGLGVTVECLGYVNLLDYPYTQTATLGDVDLSNNAGTGKLQLVITADLNSIFSTSWTQTVNNTLQVETYENQNRTALTIIKELVSKGDASANRYLFGIYDGLQAVYEAVSDDVAYHENLRDAAQRITTPQGDEVKPWNVRPGRWLFYPDFLVGRTPPSARRLDPRFEFIESVTYTAPYGISHQGGVTDTIPQLLAQKGLAGAYT